MATTTTEKPDIAAPAVSPVVVAPTGIIDQMVPWAAMGALGVAAAAARIAVHATGSEADVVAGVAATAFVVAVVAACATRRRIVSRAMRARLLAALFLGAAWLTMVTAAGFSMGALAMLTIIGSGLSLLYWRDHRIPNGGDLVATPLIERADDSIYVTRWNANLAREGKALAGAVLVEPENIKAGYRYVMQMVPGVHTVDQARAIPEMLRSGLQLKPGQEAIVEEHPDRPAPTGILTIVTRPQVNKPRPWPGPEASFDSATGSVNLGPFVDGEGTAQWSVYKKDGVFGGFLQGAPGSGKSRMTESVAMALAASKTHPTVIWYADGQAGSSSPMLVKHADYVATTFEAIYDMLGAAIEVMKINGVENRRSGAVGFHPTDARPGLCIFLDEQHKPLDKLQNPKLADATRMRAATIAREGRKVGVFLIGADQSPTLEAFGGQGNDAEVLRASLLEGNGVILSSKNKNVKQVFAVDVNPSLFPKLPGYAYLCNPDDGARSAPFRGYWVTDEMAAVWPKRIAWRTLPTRQANAAGSAYARRFEVAAEQAMADELLLEMADAGTLGTTKSLMDDMDRRAAEQGSDAGDGFPAVRQVPRFWMPEEVNQAGLKEGQQKVLDAIRAGYTRPIQIQGATQYSESQVHNLLKDLTKLGRIRKPIGHDGREVYGEYEVLAA